MYLLFDHLVATVIFLIGIPAVGTCVGPLAGVGVWAMWMSSTGRPIEKNDKVIGAAIGILVATVGLGIGVLTDGILLFFAIGLFSAS